VQANRSGGAAPTTGGRGAQGSFLVRLVSVTLLVGAALAGAPASAAAPQDRVVTVSPPTGPPGTTFTLRIDGCVEEPIVEVRDQFQIRGIKDVITFTDLGGGSWSGQYAAGDVDTELDGADCYSTGSLHASFDVDNPLLLTENGYFPQASAVTGTDCPAGGTPAAEVTVDGEPWPFDTTPPDAGGDWRILPLEGLPMEAQVVISATCGGVTYTPFSYRVPYYPPPTTIPTTSVPAGPIPGGPGPAPAPAPASAVRGRADFTG
jgi:hypothetical protein